MTSPRPARPRVASLLTRTPVDRKTYLAVGLSLMLLKVLAEGALGYAMTGVWPSPWVYFAPVLSLRNSLLGADAPGWQMGLLIAWTLPFAWVGVSYSVRRAQDAGVSPWVGLGFLLPFLNYLFLLVLTLLPTQGKDGAAATAPDLADLEVLEGAKPLTRGGMWAALVGVFAGAALSLVFVGLSATVLGKYGGGVFLGTPFLMGALAGFLYTRDEPRSTARVLGVGVATQLIGALLLLLSAVEGLICLAMALPIACVAGALGALLGAQLTRVGDAAWRRALGVPFLALPLLTVVEPPPETPRVVETRVVVDAPPETVWDLVIAFPEIPADTESTLLFRAGVAMPLRARIDGRGVGAVRHCEFTTGAFVEPVTVWDPPHHLAFDVTAQPEPMAELSPWKHVHAPHLVNNTLRSERGEFRLKALPGGKTELVGRTWYRVNMAPEPYWAAWVDVVVHQVHLRVLRHIGREAAARSAARP